MNRNFHIGFLWVLTSIVILMAGPITAQTKVYDPLRVPELPNPETLDLTVKDSQRNRTIPVLIYLPSHRSQAPVVLFSHGLGGSRQGNVYMGQHWAKRGYTAVFVQHPGSDTSVWKDKILRERMPAMKKAASPRNFLLRVKDVVILLDQLERWNTSKTHPLQGRLDLKHIGMSGHSFGAVTTQAVSGQTTQRGNASLADSRIRAAIAFSPSSPRLGNPGKAFGRVKIPWMLMTGTKDTAPIGEADMESRLSVFPALPSGGKYELVLYNAEHSAFTARALPGDTEKRNPNHHRVVLALSTAFWDTWLREDAGAKTWLNGDGPHTLLEENDRWQKK